MKRCAGLLLITIVIALRTMAYAKPPDPDWIAGFWDGGDYDDVVILVTSVSTVTETAPSIDVRPAQIVVESVQTDDDSAILLLPSLPHQSRAPPIA